MFYAIASFIIFIAILYLASKASQMDQKLGAILEELRRITNKAE